MFVRPWFCLKPMLLGIRSIVFFFWKLAQLYLVRIRKVLLCPNVWKIDPKLTKNGVFRIFWKILSLIFPGNDLKWKTILLCTFYCKTLIFKKIFWFSSYGPKCSEAIRLQDCIVWYLKNHCTKNWSFPLWIFPVNVTKSAVS